MEFLASVQDSNIFPPVEKAVLGRFLETVDLLKFSKAEARQGEPIELLLQAEQLVHAHGHALTNPVADGEGDAKF